jgi:nitrous oxide reductase accessory protein NosL
MQSDRNMYVPGFCNDQGGDGAGENLPFGENFLLSAHFKVPIGGRMVRYIDNQRLIRNTLSMTD